jgi:hypothetical protein
MRRQHLSLPSTREFIFEGIRSLVQGAKEVRCTLVTRHDPNKELSEAGFAHAYRLLEVTFTSNDDNRVTIHVRYRHEYIPAHIQSGVIDSTCPSFEVHGSAREKADSIFDRFMGFYASVAPGVDLDACGKDSGAQLIPTGRLNPRPGVEYRDLGKMPAHIQKTVNACDKINKELMERAWAPHRFVDWCLDEEEKKDLSFVEPGKSSWFSSWFSKAPTAFFFRR